MGLLWDIFFTGEAEAGSGGFNSSHGPSEKATGHHESSPKVFDEQSMFWALRHLPVADAPKHFMVCGTVGSGKTVLINLFLQSIAPRFQHGRSQPEQLIIFDAKCDIIPTLAALGYEPDDPNVWLMNPFDERSAIWNLAEAMQQPAMARYLATLLVPEEKNSTAPYFSNAAREIVCATIIALNTVRGKKWTFRDLLCALDSPDHIRRITAQDAHAQRLAQRFIDDEEHFHGVISSLAARLGRFSQVAALWHSHPKPRYFSVEEFLKKPGVLVLGYDPVLNDSLWPINALLLKTLTNEILRQSDTRRPRHWFVLDEFRAMEKVECMLDLLNRGRSKGAAVMLGLQSVEGMMNVYQQHGANELLGLCGHKTFLRSGSAETAKWAEEFFNKIRTTEHIITEQWSSAGYSHSIQHQWQDRPLFLASMFLGLPYPEKGWLVTINDVPDLNAATIARRPFQQILSWRQPPVKIEAIHRRTSIADQKLKPWSSEEEAQFCRQDMPDSSKPAKAADEKPKRKSKLPPRRSGKS